MRATRALFMLLAVTAFFVAPAVAGSPDPFETNVTFPVHLALAYTWDGQVTGYADWYLNMDKTFTDSQGGTGKWAYNSATGTLAVKYLVGCCPLYAGTRTSSGHFDGEMNCRCVSTGHGVWSADYVPSAAPHQPNPTGVPNASSPE